MNKIIIPFAPHPQSCRTIRAGGTKVAWGDGQILSGHHQVIENVRVLDYWNGREYEKISDLDDDKTYLLIVMQYNSHQRASCKNHSRNLTRINSVSREFFAYFLLEVCGGGEWVFDADEPRTYSHGWILRRLRGDAKSSRSCDNERDAERNGSTEVWSSEKRFIIRSIRS
jgi:hypothetical protein